ncbi:U11/U12 small nuclear ribonucleoprotein 25 kDa protein [Prorops nasuta]|uniref:U11/U12 small nuclear ribonucleoprotein 25 kDa protein n=1 Tax=Prorops nasuta TaxID=863751 RepID=UPI0034CDFE4E
MAELAMLGESGCADFKHEELVKLTQKAIDWIIKSDPIFKGLPNDITIEEIKAQVAVARGQAITLYLQRENLSKISIVVPSSNITVWALKKTVKRDTNLLLKREEQKKKISWKHIWDKYDLSFKNVRLSDNTKTIKTYGVVNKSVLQYVKKKHVK